MFFQLIKNFFLGGTSLNFTVTGFLHLVAGVPVTVAFTPAIILGCAMLWALTDTAIKEVRRYA